VHVLMISGSTRPGSSNTLVLQRLHRLDSADLTTELYEGLAELPGFVPGTELSPPLVARVLGRIRSADAVLLSTPEYAGGLPGTLKNLLDWTVGGGELYGKPVAWLDVANPGRGAGAREQLRTVLGYVGARVVESACVHVDLVARDAETPLTHPEELSLSGVRAALADAIEEDRRATDT
jgi:chromate reductase, NAD(P)H dehydrogenase (quinone)